MQKLVNRSKNYSGMTLVEILVSLVILGLVLIAILPLVTQSLKVTNLSSSITSQLFSLQEDIEIVAVTKDGAYLIDGTFVPKDFFPVLMNGETTWVPGMTVKKSKLVRFLASNLGSEYELFERYEGYTAEEAEITIEDKSIKNTSTVTVIDKNNSNITSHLDGFPIISGNKLTIKLPTDDSNRFTNLNSLYTITVSTDGKKLTSLLMVHLPRGIIANENGELLIASSPNPDNWFDSSGNSKLAKKANVFDYRINKIVSAGTSDRSARFIAVGNNGSIYLWEDGKEWKRLTLKDSKNKDITTNLNHILAVDSGGWLVAGDNGLILYSDDAKTWIQRTSETTSNLRAIAYNKKNNKYFCVGDDGIILTSANAQNWIQLHTNPLMAPAAGYIGGRKAVAFSGEGEYLKTEKNPVTGNKFTVFMVVKPTKDPVNTSLVTLGSPSSYFTLRTNEDKKLAVGTTNNVFEGNLELATDEPSFIAYRYDGPKVSIYKNALPEDFVIGSVTPGGDPTQLGNNPLTSYNEPLPFAGSIAEVFVFNRALSTERENRLFGGKYASEMDVVNKYLSLKYDISLADTDINNFYYHGTFSSPQLVTMTWASWQNGSRWPFTSKPTYYPNLDKGVMWFNASDTDSLNIEDEKQVMIWKDISGAKNHVIGAVLNAAACNDDGLLYAGGDRRNLIYYNGTAISQDNKNLNTTKNKKLVQYSMEDMLFAGDRILALLNDKHEKYNYIVSLDEPENHTVEKTIENHKLNDLFNFPYGKTILVVGNNGGIYYAQDNTTDWKPCKSGNTNLLAACLR